MLPGARQLNKMREMGWLGKKPSRWNTPTSILANWGHRDVRSNTATSFKISKRPKIPKFWCEIPWFLNIVLHLAYGWPFGDPFCSIGQMDERPSLECHKRPEQKSNTVKFPLFLCICHSLCPEHTCFTPFFPLTSSSWKASVYHWDSILPPPSERSRPLLRASLTLPTNCCSNTTLYFNFLFTGRSASLGIKSYRQGRCLNFCLYF